ncbi:hypothetical protein [Cerasicoccus fimbriatus]|uniref:hypothetical protein n=1 Tax=Cerasicoccus fimbriatus TaxID=3014554 RepID=UPI0022B47475|nr:hypothetical protein [Cerasicoccus sp. TK19100]
MIFRCTLFLLAALTLSAANEILIQDFDIALEGGEDQEVIVLFTGPNGTPHDIARILPGPWSIDLADLPPDYYTVTLYSEGYAETDMRLKYTDDGFVVTSTFPNNTVTLYRKRYVTLEIIRNTKRGRELTGPDVERSIKTYTYRSTPESIRHDYRLTQIPPDADRNDTSRESGSDLILRRHRFSGFFGTAIPSKNDEFEQASLAPSNDEYDQGRVTPLIPGSWFFMRISGHRPETIAYLKVRVLAYGLEPPNDIPVEETISLRWERALDTAERLGIDLPQ